MKKSFAKITFTPKEGREKDYRIPQGTWYSTTWGCEPNDWSVRFIDTGESSSDCTMIAEMDFLMEDASYLLKKGSKFKLFPGGSCYAEVEVIQEIE